MNRNPTSSNRRSRLFLALFLGGVAPFLSGLQSIPPEAPLETQPILDYSIEARSEISREKVLVGETFQYTLTLSWEGSQPWISLEPPETSWPDSVRQEDIRTKSASKSGLTGPVGEKAFLYDLSVSTPGTVRLPDVEIEILFLDSSKRTVTAPGREIVVEERPTPPSEKLRRAIEGNKGIALGLSALVAAAVFFGVLTHRKRVQTPTVPEDVWAPLEERLKKCEALQKSGQAREFHEEVEAVVLDACRILTGREERRLEKHLGEGGLPKSIEEAFAPFAAEIEERKFRPDRPRPEELQRTYKQAKSILASLQELHQSKGS